MAGERDLKDPHGPSDPTRAVGALAAEQHGVLSLDELRRCGLSGRQVKRAGWLHRVHVGVYAVGHANLTLEGRFLAAVKACGPTALLSHRAAAAHFGFLPWEERLIDVTVPGDRRPAGIRAHRSTRAEGKRERGIPTTTPARTLLDLAATRIPDEGLRRAVREAQAQRRVHVRDLRAALAQHRGRRGTARLASFIEDGPAPTRSALEDAVLDLIEQAGLPRPRINEPIRVDGRRLVPDFRWPAQRLIVEADGARWHDPVSDARRQALLEASGERVLRISWDEAVRRREETVARLRAAFG
jgi:very-short-patch-repair endonuclease